MSTKKTKTPTPKTAAELKTEGLKDTKFTLTYKVKGSLIDACRDSKGFDEDGNPIYVGPARLKSFVGKVYDIADHYDVSLEMTHRIADKKQIITLKYGSVTAEITAKGVTDFVRQLCDDHQDLVVALLAKTGERIFVPVIKLQEFEEEG